MGRPCLAGTQTAHHQANQHGTVTEFPNISTFGDLTHDSSGFGSLLVEQSNNSNLTIHQKSAERTSVSWPRHNLIHLESDTSDLGLEQSALGEQHQVEPRVERTEYPIQLATSVKSPGFVPGTTSMCPRSKLDFNIGNESRDESHASNLHVLSARESRMLEENLASVARYVEELTGCAGASKSTTTNLSLSRPDITRTPLLQETKSERTAQPSEDLPSITLDSFKQTRQTNQLQQINLAALSTLKTGKANDGVGMGTAAHELLTRLLANQFPELVFSASSLPVELKQERPNWSAESTSPLSRPSLPANHSPELSASFEHQTELTSLRGSGQTTPMQVSLDEAVRGPGYQSSGVGTSVDGCVGQTQEALLEKNGRPNRIDSPAVSCCSTAAGTPPCNYEDLQTTRTVNQSGTSTTNPVAMLAGLFGTSADQLLGLLNNQLRQCIGNDTGCAPATAALSALLAGLQETAITNRCRQLKERTSSVNQLNLSSYHETGILPNPTQQPMASTSNLNEEIARLAEPYKRFLCSLESDIERAANVYRTSASTLAQKREAAYHWSGKLPVRVCRSMAFSRKVFLGGVPWDSTSEDLIMAFSRFGNVTVSWPQQDGSQFNAIRSRNPSPKGYCYLIFDHESSVTDLIDACIRDPTRGGDYYTISSSRFRAKDVQVIPWVISDSQYTKSGPYRPDTKRTVFIGALHGMITAEALVTIMNDLFGNVIFAALDTDKYKYPIGSGRVAFSSYKSYLKAVTANFVDIRTSKFIKTIQIDPYLEDSLCNSCQHSPGIYFCRDFECFRYFCPACWQLWHNSTGSLFAHKPLRRTFKPIPERQLPSLIKH
ncbi:hypothetical protein CRM22_003395 [Opisthorchis felineus]|nr:hypothetical protein CRM22_003395 [Opisthorchis felineus]